MYTVTIQRDACISVTNLHRPLFWYTCVRSAPARSSADTVLISSIQVAGLEVGLMAGTPASHHRVLNHSVTIGYGRGSTVFLSRHWPSAVAFIETWQHACRGQQRGSLFSHMGRECYDTRITPGMDSK